jgi:NAD(P)H-hydrate repair Nnr-like enzyme with NAD(P)H-hydrate dehydratase domain
MPEALVAPLEVDGDNRLVGDAVADALGQRVAHAQAILIGPGMSGIAAIRTMIEHIAKHMADDSVLVGDAAALQAIATTDRALLRALAGRLVLTPNRDELAGLADALGVRHDDVDDGAAGVARDLGAVVTCFGEIAAFDDRCWRAEPATPGLGTSGSGDVLAGLVAGAAARCRDAAQAACWATHVHAMAGNRLSERLGTMSFIARELLDEVPQVLATLD